MDEKELILRIKDMLGEDDKIASVMDIEGEENTLGVQAVDGERFFVTVERV